MKTLGFYLLGAALACSVMWALSTLDYETTTGWTYEQRFEDKFACCDASEDMAYDQPEAYNQVMARWAVPATYQAHFIDAYCACRTDVLADSLQIPWNEHKLHTTASELRFRQEGWRKACLRAASQRAADLKGALP